MLLNDLRFSGQCADPEIVRENFNKIRLALLSFVNEPEIIEFTGVSTVSVPWTSTRIINFGSFPQVEAWLIDPADGQYHLAPVQPTIDAPPPDFTLMSFDFGGNVTGFIILK